MMTQSPADHPLTRPAAARGLRARTRRWRTAAAGLAAAGSLVLGACANPPLAPGLRQAEVRALWGPPTGVLTRPEGGLRLEYATGPFGKQTWMVDLDADDRVLQWEQVLQEARFDRVSVGMDREALRRFIGRPSARRAGGWPGGEVWSWRYDAVFCQWFQVSLDDDGRVTSSAYGPDPLCEQNDGPRLFR